MQTNENEGCIGCFVLYFGVSSIGTLILGLLLVVGVHVNGLDISLAPLFIIGSIISIVLCFRYLKKKFL